MKKLSLTLIVAIVSATVGLGWLVSNAYKLVASKGIEDTFTIYKKLSADIAYVVNQNDDLSQSLLGYWPEDSLLQMDYLELEDFPVPQALQESFLAGEVLTLESVDQVTLYRFLNKHNVVLGFTLPRENRKKDHAINLFFTISFYLGLIIIILVWLYPLLRRLSILTKASQIFGSGDFSFRIPSSRTSYISNIEKEFNAMAARIETLLEDNKLLSRAVSHNLKTPLARLRFGLDTLMEADTEEKREAYYERVEDDLSEMESLIYTLLNFAKMESTHIEYQVEKIDLRATISHIVKLLASNKVQFDESGSLNELYISIDKKYLTMLLNNIIENAVKYSKSLVVISLQLEKDHVLMTVEDDGPGMSEEECAQIFQPFWRGDNQPKSISGHGMGMAIVKKIAHWFNIKLCLDRSDRLGGLSISLRFER